MDLKINFSIAVTVLTALVACHHLKANAAAPNCFQQNGTDMCVAPTPTKWTYDLINVVGSPAELFSWCVARGGSWANGGCGGNPESDTEQNLLTHAKNYAKIMGTNCVLEDSGWGKTISAGSGYVGSPTYSNGILVIDLRELVYHCDGGGTVPINARRARNLTCPKPTQANYDLGLMVCTPPVEKDRCGVGNPIIPSTGRKVQNETDGAFEGRSLKRFYNSFGSAHHFLPGSIDVFFDDFWRGDFDLRVEAIQNSNFTELALSKPDGSLQYFRSDGTPFLKMGDSSKLLKVAAGYEYRDGNQYAKFNSQGRLVEIKFIDGGSFYFSYSDGTSGPGGKLAQDASGLSTGAAVPQNLLIYVTSSNGRVLGYERDAAGKISKIIDPSGRIIARYFYNDNSRLDSVVYQDNGGKYYHYNEPALTGGADLPFALTGISEFNGDSSTRFASFGYDSSGNAVSTEHAGGVDKYSLNFAIPKEQTTVTSPLNKSFTYKSKVIQGIVFPNGVSQPGGAGCSAATSQIEYDTNGNVASQDDFNGHRTCYANDLSRNLETNRVEGLANTATCSTVTTSGATLPAGSRKLSSQWHPDWAIKIKQAEPSKLTTWVYNGQPDPFNSNQIANCVTPSYGASSAPTLPDGKPIVVLCKQVEQPTLDADGSKGLSAGINTAQSARTLKYTYTQYGQVLTSVDARGNTTTNAYYQDTAFTGAVPNEVGHYQGDLQTETNAKGHVTTYTSYDRAGKPLSMSDPNGLVTNYAYWPRGWIKSVKVGLQTTSYDYWPTGLLKQVTSPDGSTLNYVYDDAHRLTDVTDNLGHTVHYTLDSAGNRINEEVKDNGYSVPQLSRQIQRAYDDLNRLKSVIGATQ